MVCVYGPGHGRSYGLGAPDAVPMSPGWESSAYLALSTNVLFGYETSVCVSIAGGGSSFDEALRAGLLRREPLYCCGRTVRIYRIRDVIGGLPSRGP